MIWFEILANGNRYEIYRIFNKRTEQTCEFVKACSEAEAKSFASKHWVRKAPWKK